MNALVTKIRAWLTSSPLPELREDKLIGLMTEMVHAQRAQTEVFAKLVGVWTQPVPVEAAPRSQSEVEAYDALEDAAENGDPDAQTILANEDAFRSYVAQFR